MVVYYYYHYDHHTNPNPNPNQALFFLLFRIHCADWRHTFFQVSLALSDAIAPMWTRWHHSNTCSDYPPDGAYTCIHTSKHATHSFGIKTVVSIWSKHCSTENYVKGVDAMVISMLEKDVLCIFYSLNVELFVCFILMISLWSVHC